MERRSFLSAAVALSPLGHHVGRVLNARRPGRASNPAPRPRSRAILLSVRVADCAGWYPNSWRDVPDVPFHVSRTIDAGASLAACRMVAKHHNQIQLEQGACSWLIVVATDGRLTRRSRWRVDVVCDATGLRASAGEFDNEQEATELADWFGRNGSPRAEVIRTEGGAV